MKKIILLLMILSMLFSATACSMLEEILASTAVVDTGSFSIEIPSTYMELEDQDNAYYIDSKDMYIAYHYYPKEFSFDSETMMNILATYLFLAEDIVKTDKMVIDGVDVYQVQYRTLSTGLDNIHYYYSGLFSIFELDNEFLTVDTYKYMEESVGINTYISDDDLQLLHDMTNSVKITGDSGMVYTKEEMYSNMLKVELSDQWAEVGDQNGVQEWGYGVEFGFGGYDFYIDVLESSDEYANDMTTLLDTYSEYPEYSYYGDITIADEAGYAFIYEFDSGDGSYVYGVFGETEHYYVDVYFYTVLEDYEMPDEVAKAIFDFINSVQ
ncbi:MAG: hypothetical protein AB1Z23_12350 [Eubacteriales bacterium]